mgnify:CR=1 FL=1
MGEGMFCEWIEVCGEGGGWGAAPAARQRRRSGRRPLKTARRAVWAAPYGCGLQGPGQRENSSPKNAGAGDAKSPRFYAGDFLHSL